MHDVHVDEDDHPKRDDQQLADSLTVNCWMGTCRQ